MTSRKSAPRKPAEPISSSPAELTSSEKVMQTFRMPLDLVYEFKAEARARGLDATAHVIRVMEGYHRYYGLPRAIVEKLEEDRSQMGMDRFEYFQHVLFRRSEAVEEQGTGFDRPGSGQRRK